MSISGLLFALALSVVAMVIVARPLWRSAAGESDAARALQRQRDQVRIYYERVLTNIRDLDEDFATGKIGTEDYSSEREVWVHRGIRLLRAQDQLEAQGDAAGSSADAAAIERAIDEAVAAYRQAGLERQTGEETA